MAYLLLWLLMAKGCFAISANAAPANGNLAISKPVEAHNFFQNSCFVRTHDYYHRFISASIIRFKKIRSNFAFLAMRNGNAEVAAITTY
jgi:hypothetical protein